MTIEVTKKSVAIHLRHHILVWHCDPMLQSYQHLNQHSWKSFIFMFSLCPSHALVMHQMYPQQLIHTIMYDIVTVVAITCTLWIWHPQLSYSHHSSRSLLKSRVAWLLIYVCWIVYCVGSSLNSVLTVCMHSPITYIMSTIHLYYVPSQSVH